MAVLTVECNAICRQENVLTTWSALTFPMYDVI